MYFKESYYTKITPPSNSF